MKIIESKQRIYEESIKEIQRGYKEKNEENIRKLSNKIGPFTVVENGEMMLRFVEVKCGIDVKKC